MDSTFFDNGKCYCWVYAKYIVKNGKRIYPKTAKAFRLKVEIPCSSCKQAFSSRGHKVAALWPAVSNNLLLQTPKILGYNMRIVIKDFLLCFRYSKATPPTGSCTRLSNCCFASLFISPKLYHLFRSKLNHPEQPVKEA